MTREQHRPLPNHIQTIEAARCERGMSVAELARRIDVDRKRLWYILNGQREMRVDEFLKACVVLNLGLARFVTKEEAEKMRSKWKR